MKRRAITILTLKRKVIVSKKKMVKGNQNQCAQNKNIEVRNQDMNKQEEQQDNIRQSLYYREFPMIFSNFERRIPNVKMLFRISLTLVLTLLLIIRVIQLPKKIRFNNLLSILSSKLWLQD